MCVLFHCKHEKNKYIQIQQKIALLVNGFVMVIFKLMSRYRISHIMMFLGELRLSPSTLSSPMQHGRVNRHKVVNLDQFMLAHSN